MSHSPGTAAEKESAVWNPRVASDAVAVVRGKGNKDKVGWGSLPPRILHRILDHSVADIGAHTPLTNLPSDRRPNLAVHRALLTRIWLCSLRLVSSAWRDTGKSISSIMFPAIFFPPPPLPQNTSHMKHVFDTFSFWNLCIAYFAPDHAQLAHDPTPLTSSTRSPSAFSRARSAASSVCMLCRLNRPFSPPHPADHRCTTLTPKYGFLPCCVVHVNRFCFSCLIAAPDHHAIEDTVPASFSEFNEDPTILALCKSTPRDVDENGYTRARLVIQCAACRKVIIDRQIDQLLLECSRGGALLGKSNRFDCTASYGEYVVWSEQTAYHAAQMAVDEDWLLAQTRWSELSPSASDLEKHYLALRAQFKIDGIYETPAQKRQRHNILRELWWGAKGHDYRVDEADLARRYKAWRLEGMQNVIDDDFEPGTGLSAEGRPQLRIACIQDWITSRITNGFWMAPSDEVRLLVTKPAEHINHFQRLAASAIHPVRPHALHFAALQNYDGFMDMRVQHGNSPFLPTPRLLEEMDLDYRESLRAMLGEAMEEYVHVIFKQCGGNHDAADRICERMGVNEILAGLTDKLVWCDNAAEATILPGKSSSTSEAASLRVELVREEVDEARYLIKLDDDDAEDVTDDSATSEEIRAALDAMPDTSTDGSSSADDTTEPRSTPSKRKEPADYEIQTAEPRKRSIPFSPDQSGLDTESTESSDDLSSIPGPVTPDEFAPRISPHEGSEVSGSRSPKTRTIPLPELHGAEASSISSSSMSPVIPPVQPMLSQVQDSKAKAIPNRDSPSDAQLKWRTDPHEIPWIPQVPPDGLGNVTVQSIMAAWFEARAFLRECRCGICEREKGKAWWLLEMGLRAAPGHG